MNIVAIIQARMGSSRLPNKVLMDINDYPMLYHVVQRALRANKIDLVVVATSTADADQSIAAFCEEQEIPYFRGNENDVLDRYYQTAKKFSADIIVRLTADCPLLDPNVIDKVILAFQAGKFDYVSNTLVCTYPDGLDTEVFTFEALEQAWKEATLCSEREHVTPYIHKHPEKFSLQNVTHFEDMSHLRWTVDEPNDLILVKKIYKKFKDTLFGMEDVMAVLTQETDLNQANSQILRNEGYIKSLREDEVTK